MVTRHFTGLWDQVDHESQGIALQVVAQSDGSRKAVAYWFTYDTDRATAWFVGIGPLEENRIKLDLYDSTDVGFLQEAQPGNDSVHRIGAMTITFDSCVSGMVEYATSHPVVTNGSFRIERLAEIMNTHCSGGLSDDLHADALFGEQRIDLVSARNGVIGNGYARFEDFPGHIEFEIEVEGLPDGEYHLFTGFHDRGSFIVQQGRGELEFASPGETGKLLLAFDPRGMPIEINDGQGAVLSSIDGRFETHEGGHYGEFPGGDDEHDFECGMGHGPGHGMGAGMIHCVEEGEFIKIEVDLDNTGIYPEASGEAEWEMNTQRIEFSVDIEDVPAGAYSLVVDGTAVGDFQALEMHGEVAGKIEFRDPEVFGKQHLDFEPRGALVRVLRDGHSILEVEFPEE